jgi:flagellar basal-body rod modification protein FlgD
MGIPPVGDTSMQPSDSASKAGLDRDAFLKLLVAQLSHQDPTQPMQGTEFVTQLSQFAAVEQAVAQSSKLDLLSAQLRGISSNEAVALVGKKVSIRSNGLAFDGVSATSASVTLSAPASTVKVTIRDASGRAVRTMNLGARGAGALAIAWDGRDDNGQPVAKGNYSFTVDAKDGGGNAVAVSLDVSGLVKSVSFEKGYPEIQLDSGAKAPISDLVSVSSP